MISYRKVKRGEQEDWIVFEALPAVRGIGILKTGQPKAGYKTGQTFGRRGTEAEAHAWAEQIAAEVAGEVVAWQPPEPDPQFADLPMLFPRSTNFATAEEAEAAGWLWIAPGKTLEHYRGVKIACKDTSRPGEFGYDLAIICMGREMARSTTVWVGGRFSPRFRTGEIVRAIHEARAMVDEDQITQKEASRLAAVGLPAISNALKDGRLNAYPAPAYTQARGPLVSREEVKRVWSIGG